MQFFKQPARGVRRGERTRYGKRTEGIWRRLYHEPLEDRTLLAATFVVNTATDSVDVNPGDGVAADAQGFTSLRAAVMEANALAGDDTIQLGAGSNILSLSGADSDATHDLDITSNITIVATSNNATVIVGTAGGRIIEVHSGGSLTLTGVEVIGGNTSGSGGGIFNNGGTLHLEGSTISGNTATSGGGIFNSGSLTISNSTISGNTGGGIDNAAGGILEITRSTISDNTADSAAGVDNSGTVMVNNTIIAGNIGTVQNTDIAGSFNSGGYNLIGSAGAGVTGLTADDIVGTPSSPLDPRLAPLANNGGTTSTHELMPGSLAIDAGLNNVADLSGNNHTASIIGSVTAGDGQLGGGANFPGGVGDVADDYLSVDVENIPLNQIPTSAITVAAWAKLTQTGFRHAIFASRTGDGDFISHAELLPDGRARFTLRDNNGNTIVDFLGGAVPFDQWFHYAATYDQPSNQVTVYINGNVIFNGAATINANIGADWDSGARIGSTTSDARPFTGQMDEFYLFKRALSKAEILTLIAVPSTPTGVPLVSGDLVMYYSFDDLISSATDQRGGPRVLDGDGIFGATIDIGSVERFNDFDPNNPIPEEIQTGNISVHISPIASGLVSPSFGVHAGDGSGRLFVTDQFGLVHLFKNGELQNTPFLDITHLVPDVLNGNDERGLSGFTFHPDYANMGTEGYGKFYTWVDEDVFVDPPDFTHYPLEPGVSRAAQTVLREWTMTDPSADVFAGTSREILRIDQPHQAHSGGAAVFGADGYLYLSLGDGGTHDDQGPGHNPDTGNARDLTNIYGSVLRIDPFGNNSANGKYGIPADNPFVNDEEALDEIFFYGLRNPFRFSFGRDAQGQKTSQIIIADTGQDHLEEVNLVDTTTAAGAHFGWNVKEGSFIFDAGPPPSPQGEFRIGATAYSPGNPLGLTDPIVEYDHGPNGEGTAVIGGFVYQGDLIPELKGKYVFGDFNEKFTGPTVPNGRIFYFDVNDPDPEIFELDLEGALLSGGGGLSMFIKGFGLDEDGEIYVIGSTTLASADNSGVILKLTPTVPGVSVNPTVGLETSEDGGTAEFDIVLTTQPTNNVTIAIASDNTNEGTVSTNSVTFTTDNWNTAQTVTITGQDDDDIDGLVAYHIELGPVTSSDSEYSGLDPDDLLVHNIDNDVDPFAITVDVGAARDNTLYEAATVQLSNGMGDHFFAGMSGTSNNDSHRRGLLAFDVSSAIPTGAIIVDVSLQLHMSRTVFGATDVSLHRVTSDWGEGASHAPGQEGGGIAAQTGDASWKYSFYDTQLWTTEGGDFNEVANATTSVNGVGFYSWSSPAMIADVLDWIANPNDNFGWMLIGDESQLFTAKRFDSLDNPTAENRPVLSITYSVTGSPLIAVSDNSDATDDNSVKFTTAISNYRTGVPDSDLVRPAFPDAMHYFEVTNNGDVPLTLFELQINAPDVLVDVPLTSSSGDDIVLAQGETQRFNLTFAPTFPNLIDPSHLDFAITNGIVLLSDAANTPSLEIALQGKSTFGSDINHDGAVNFGDLGIFNSNFGLNPSDGDYDPTADINGGGVNFNDLGQLNVEFGRDINNPPPFAGDDPSPKKSSTADSGGTSNSFTSESKQTQTFIAPEPTQQALFDEDETDQLAVDAAKLVAPTKSVSEPAPVVIESQDAYLAAFEEIGGGGTLVDSGESNDLFEFDASLLEELARSWKFLA